MSNFRQRAKEVRDAGKAERGNFTPHGAPKQMYDYWLGKTKSNKGRDIRNGSRRENFCHYWRVVLFWGPLRWVAQKAEDNIVPLSFIAMVAALVALVASWFIFDGFFVGTLFVLAVILGLALLTAGAIGGAALMTKPADRNLYDLPSGWKMWVCAILGLPAALVVMTGSLIGKGWNRYVKDWANDHAFVLFALTLASLFAFWFVFLAIAEGFLAALAFLGIVVGVIVLVAALLLGGSLLADNIAGKRKLAAQMSAPVAPASDTVSKPRKPSKVGNFFRGVGDFIVFLAQVVRVNKWKICPLVEVNEKDKYES